MTFSNNWHRFHSERSLILFLLWMPFSYNRNMCDDAKHIKSTLWWYTTFGSSKNRRIKWNLTLPNSIMPSNIFNLNLGIRMKVLSLGTLWHASITSPIHIDYYHIAVRFFSCFVFCRKRFLHIHEIYLSIFHQESLKWADSFTQICFDTPEVSIL